MSAPRSTRVGINGWVCLNKPVGVTSTQAVGRVKFLLNAKKAGHAGTLDPLASGVLPIALGEATKTVSVIQDGAKTYRFGVRWGEETDTDDAEGRVVAQSDRRPDASAIEAMLPRFIGRIMQVPPVYSAIKIDGERAYDRAREGEAVVMEPREITVHSLRLTSATPDVAMFEAECGKGAYVRAIARDLGRMLCCFGHVVLLVRARVGPFTIENSTGLDDLADRPELRAAALQPIEAGLAELPCVPIDRDGATQLRRGQKLLIRGARIPPEGRAWASCFGEPVAFGMIEAGEFASTRVFNLRA